VPPATTETQPELFTVETVQGYATLKAKERRFVQALFEGKNQREAARAAGIVGNDKRLDEAGCRLARTRKVSALMNQAWARSGASIDDTLKQAAELQRITFAEATSELTAERRKAAFDQWGKVSALIASIHGRLQLNVTGSVAHTHTGEVSFTLPPSALPVLAQMRRDVVTPAAAASRN
jgi:hypothetical protein